MPEDETVERAREDEREGKAPSTQAGEFVREEMEHIREGEHGARSPEQAIAIALSKARRAGVKLPRVISQKGAPRAAESPPPNALAQRHVHSSARAVSQRRSKRCRDTRSEWRADALHGRARLP